MNPRALCLLVVTACSGGTTGLEALAPNNVDNFGVSAQEATADSDGDGHTINDGDCDDENAEISPDAKEVCDEVDNNCNGEVDEDLLIAFYLDADGDGYGDPSSMQEGCGAPKGHVSDNTDCDDDDSEAYTYDACDECGGQNACVDCAGTPYGNAEMDKCGNCDEDTSNDCTQDCNGTWGGTSFTDCSGTCLSETAVSWIGDGYCDNGSVYANFDCEAYDNDGGDCSASGCTQGSCESGYVQDCSGDGDCCPETWIGDGFSDCSDQAWGCDLTCCNNDGGDC